MDIQGSLPHVGFQPNTPHVLAVDDDADIRTILTFMLIKQGFSVTTATNGIEALTSVATNMPDLILLDARMPQLDGFATCQQIRNLPNGATLPILIITAYDDRASIEQAFAVGADDVVFKPFHLPLLQTRIQHMLRTHQQAHMLRANEQYLRALVEHAVDIITIVNNDMTIRYSSPSQQRLLGYEPNTPTRHLFEYVHPGDLPRIQRLAQGLQGKHGHVMTETLQIRHRDGRWRIFEVTATNLLRHPAVRGIVINSHDVTERTHAEAKLLHNAFHDTLTGLPNRALFLERLGQAHDRAIRSADRFYAVLFLDLDNFKNINDSFGHVIGDQMLIEIGQRLQQYLRPGDTIARFGGDEFAILVEELVTQHDTILVAERLLTTFEAPVMLDGKPVASSGSIGIALSQAGGSQPEDLLRDADIAMYKAKQGGHPRYAIADPTMYASILAQLQLENELRQALKREEFELYYQPKMTINGQTCQGVEALLRWHHPTRGWIAPATFIPLAEATGLIIPLGTWVIRAVCRQIRVWSDAGLPPVPVAVNISAQQFMQDDIATVIGQLIEETGVDASRLCLELTETILMEDADATIETLRALQHIGINALAIDDFGTGYSSLRYLQRFPVTMLKIDRSFVQNITTNPSDAAITAAIIALAHSLGLETIAEGVETEPQRSHLEQTGCDFFQGYLVSRPLPVDQLEALLWGEP